MWRIIGEVGQQGNECGCRRGLSDTFFQRAVEMWDDRQNHVGRVLFPILTEHLYRWPVIHPHHALQHRKQLRREPGPAFAENQVVAVVDAKAGDLLQQVELVELFLKVEKPYFPALGFEHAFQRFGSAAMSAARIKEDDCESAAHSLSSLIANDTAEAVFPTSKPASPV